MNLGYTSIFLLVALCALWSSSPCTAVQYQPTWESLDARPLPSWYDESKFGIFIHWGVFSVPSFGTEWFWNRWHSGTPEFVEFMKKNYPPNWTYADFAAHFTAEFYDPDHWADVFEASGAKYIVLTSKHHEGFCNWPTKVSFNWNAMDVGPKRDLVGDLATAVRKKEGLHFGLYHSLYEWFNPMYDNDRDSNFSTRTFVERKTMPELYELVNTYKPEVIWSDGSSGPDEYWGSKDFLAWLYNESPVKDTVVTNDRWSSTTGCKHGGYYTCSDRYNPGKLQNHKWENCMTIDKRSWGYRREATLEDYMTVLDLITTLAETVSCGGNLLMNIGPTHEGLITPIFEERLRQMGAWLKVNGEAIYSSVPWNHQKDDTNSDVWYTAQKQSDGSLTAYAIVLSWPENGHLPLGSPTGDGKVSLLGWSGKVYWSKGSPSGIVIHLPELPESQMPSQYAWVFKLEGFN